MAARRLATSVVVHRPAGSVLLPAGSVPAAVDAAMITNPACWGVDLDGDAPPSPDDGDTQAVPDASWKVAAIRQWATAHGVDLGSASRKSDLLLIIGDETAAVAPGQEGDRDGDSGAVD